MKILIVEDDARIASFLERGLSAEGHLVSVEANGRDGLDCARKEHFDLILLDRMLPYLDGMEICRILREEQRPVLILMLTAKDGLQDKIAGLRGGADDYLTKPFAFDELLARIDALSRRRAPLELKRELQTGDLILNPQVRRVTKKGKVIDLTVREFELLHYLMAHAGEVISRQRLLNSVWGYDYDPGTKIVDVYVRYLRLKIDNADGPSLIQAARGIGYMLTGGEAFSPHSN